MKHINYFDSFDLKLEIIDYNYIGKPILERKGIDFYDYKEDGITKYKDLNIEQINKLKIIKTKVDSNLLDINPFEGNYTNELNQTIKRYFTIKYDDHWLRKFLRKDIEDPYGYKNIKEPDVYESIDLIYNNRNKITEYVFNKVLQDKFKVLVKATDVDGYELIFVIEKTIENKKKYEIIFITQMKGIGHNYKYYNPSRDPINKIIKLNPNGQ